jgi:ABC-type multidrug transport system ATPase subunit
LVDQSKDHDSTIIITTHYVEEAGKAHTIGFMHNGKIIEEDKPRVLLEKYKQNVTYK